MLGALQFDLILLVLKHIVDAGLAGLLFARLTKRHFPIWRVHVFEQNPPTSRCVDIGTDRRLR